MGEKDNNNGQSDQPHSIQVMPKEVATLRKTVKELEDDTSSSGRSGGTLDTTSESADQAELLKLRQQVGKHEAERNKLEMEFMNQLSSIQRKSTEEMQSLRAQLKRTQEEARASRSGQNTNGNTTKDAQYQQMKEDLASADRELVVSRKDIDEMAKKIKKLEGQKLALIDEVTGVRMELDNQAKVITSLNDVMIENEKHFKNQVDKLQGEIKLRDATIANHKNELLQLNDSSIGLSGQKAMLLDEITDLRMQLDREEQVKREYMEKYNEIATQRGQSGREGGVMIGTLQQRASAAEMRASEMEEKIERLENELRSVTTSYKADMSRSEENTVSKETALAAEKRLVEAKQTALEKQEELNEQMRKELKSVKTRLDEQSKLASDHEREIATLTSQRVAFERKLSQSVGDHITELDHVKDEKESFRQQLESVKKELAAEKTTREELKMELESERENSTKLTAELKKHIKTVAGFEAGAGDGIKTEPESSKEETTKSRMEALEQKTTKHHLSIRRAGGTPPTLLCSPFMGPPSSPGGGAAPRSVGRGKSVSQSPSRPVPCSPSGSSSTRVLELAARFDKPRASDAETAAEQDANILAREKPVKINSPRGVSVPAPVVVATAAEAGPSASDASAELKELQQELDVTKAQNEELKQKLHKQCEVVGELRAEVATLTATRSAIQALARKEYEKQSLADKAEIKRAEQELEDVRNELDAAQNRADTVKREINMMTSERLQYEEASMDAFDRKIAANKKAYDAELNKLKVELTNAQMRKVQLERDYENQIKELEEAIEELNVECDKEIDEKQAELDTIQYKYDSQVDELERLRKEKNQLTLSMNSQSTTRKGELEELQAEVMEKTSRNTAMARELQKLEMQVEYHRDQTAEIERLKQHVTVLQRKVESQPTGTKAQLKQIELERVHDENRKLRDSLRDSGIEKRALQDKLNKALEAQGEDRSVQILRHRNEKLRKEVERLTRKLEKLAGSVERISI